MKQVRRIRKTAQENRLVRARLDAAPEDVTTTNAANREVALTTYRALRQPRGADEGVLRRILAGVSCRDYARCAEAVPQAFGLSASTVSRRFVQVSRRHLQALRERRLEGYDFVAVLLDGKTFAAECGFRPS